MDALGTPPHAGSRSSAFARARIESRFLLVITLAAIAAGTVVKIILLDHQSLWVDEMFTQRFSAPALPLSQLWSAWAYDDHPPLYYLLMHFWVQLFNETDEIALRSLSVVFALAASASAALAYRHLLPWPERLLFVTFVSCNFGLIFYAQEARQYAFVFFLSVLLLAAVLTVWQRLENTRHLSIPALLACTTVGILLSLTHLFGTLYTLSCFFLLFVLVLIYRPNHMAAFFGLMILAGIVAMIWPIWVLLNFDDITAEGTSWLVIFRDPVYLAKMTTWLLFGNPYALAIVALAGAAFVFIRWSSRQRLFPAAMWVALTPSVLVVLLAFIASMTVVPLISHRNLMVIFPGIYLALTVLFSEGQSRRNVLAISAILGVLLLWPSLADYYVPHKTQWRESAKYIAEERGCSKVSFFPPGATTHHRVYLPPPFALRPASLEGGREGNGSWQPADLAVALEQAMGTENECGVLLWVVPTNSVAKALAELELPGDIEIQQFFEAAVILHK